MTIKSEKQKKFKRVKPDMSLVNPTPLDLKFDKKSIDERIKKKKEAYNKSIADYKKQVEAENRRITKLKCPCCQKTNKELVTIYEQQDRPTVYGGFNPPAKLLSEYYVCKNCGVMFVDLKKKEIKAPEEDRFYML